MNCLRYLEEIDAYDFKNDQFYNEEYEYFSDSRICGIFLIGEKRQVSFRMIESEKNEYGYYRYLLCVPTIMNTDLSNDWNKKILENVKNAREDGYYFKEGIAGEFISIFAVFLRARFYLRSRVFRYNQEASNKTTYPVFLPNTVMEYSLIFNDEKKNLTGDLIPFFKKIIKLPDNGHFNLMHSFREYHEALKNIGIDHDIAYLKLVVAVEGVASIEKIRSSFKEDFPECFELIEGDKKRLSQISNSWANRGSLRSVLYFFEKYLLSTHPEFKETTYLSAEGSKPIFLEETINRIYNSRSKYVHEGRQMIISYGFQGSFYGPSLGGVIDRKKITIEETLPVISYFESMVNVSLISYVDKNTSSKQSIEVI